MPLTRLQCVYQEIPKNYAYTKISLFSWVACELVIYQKNIVLSEECDEKEFEKSQLVDRPGEETTQISQNLCKLENPKKDVFAQGVSQKQMLNLVLWRARRPMSKSCRIAADAFSCAREQLKNDGFA